MLPAQKMLIWLLAAVALVSAQYEISDSNAQTASGGVFSTLFDGILGAPFSLVESIIRKLIVAAMEVIATILPRWVLERAIPMPILEMLDQSQTILGGTRDYGDTLYRSAYRSANKAYN
ncbi:uncharacterized protein LOC109534212 [Dendroctonus ponderosae]|uniref:Uncharacterized protein n=1 Tax=Dendroctonus ponderosae TaxID=77166 RepID=A0AAR5P3A5_DENPD|nr:uncharacterized protein LOC109534212 [Dendroctonus ponderosae]KAH1022440.1 hypothetical protein HUJ04_011843 [Dendroctonus ponderosae]